jgi:hypothetical protein
MSTLANLERQAGAQGVAIEGGEAALSLSPRRFALYRLLVRLGTLSAALALAAWLWTSRPH